jgi:hypothetical protein
MPLLLSVQIAMKDRAGGADGLLVPDETTGHGGDAG